MEADPVDQAASLRQLADEMVSGQVQLLVILGGNPAYTAPADVPFAANLRSVRGPRSERRHTGCISVQPRIATFATAPWIVLSA